MDASRRDALRRLTAVGAGAATLILGWEAVRWRSRLISNSEIHAQEVSAFTRTFSRQIDGGGSLIECLTAAIEEQRNPRLRSILEEVRAEVEQGSALSRALARHPEAFDEAYVQEIRRGEVEGRLEESLMRLARG